MTPKAPKHIADADQRRDRVSNKRIYEDSSENEHRRKKPEIDRTSEKQPPPGNSDGSEVVPRSNNHSNRNARRNHLKYQKKRLDVADAATAPQINLPHLSAFSASQGLQSLKGSEAQPTVATISPLSTLTPSKSEEPKTTAAPSPSKIHVPDPKNTAEATGPNTEVISQVSSTRFFESLDDVDANVNENVTAAHGNANCHPTSHPYEQKHKETHSVAPEIKCQSHSTAASSPKSTQALKPETIVNFDPQPVSAPIPFSGSPDPVTDSVDLMINLAAVLSLTPDFIAPPTAQEILQLAWENPGILTVPEFCQAVDYIKATARNIAVLVASYAPDKLFAFHCSEVATTSSECQLKAAVLQVQLLQVRLNQYSAYCEYFIQGRNDASWFLFEMFQSLVVMISNEQSCAKFIRELGTRTLKMNCLHYGINKSDSLKLREQYQQHGYLPKAYQDVFLNTLPPFEREWKVSEACRQNFAILCITNALEVGGWTTGAKFEHLALSDGYRLRSVSKARLQFIQEGASYLLNNNTLQGEVNSFPRLSTFLRNAGISMSHVKHLNLDANILTSCDCTAFLGLCTALQTVNINFEEMFYSWDDLTNDFHFPYHPLQLYGQGGRRRSIYFTKLARYIRDCHLSPIRKLVGVRKPLKKLTIVFHDPIGRGFGSAVLRAYFQHAVDADVKTELSRPEAMTSGPSPGKTVNRMSAIDSEQSGGSVKKVMANNSKVVAQIVPSETEGRVGKNKVEEVVAKENLEKTEGTSGSMGKIAAGKNGQQAHASEDTSTTEICIHDYLEEYAGVISRGVGRYADRSRTYPRMAASTLNRTILEHLKATAHQSSLAFTHKVAQMGGIYMLPPFRSLTQHDRRSWRITP
ncbi:hypothetical protein EJ08DRAFT_731366 [Tothia fuscella]|uniref:Uncharacterized protein n=1 Tax=Tothia fuscella TaxID=1048955 RepID=A0A9P4NY44_9PEZI|nr:hypothetical protein EJ08DRAFT_731366 [Tothia fuscella]